MPSSAEHNAKYQLNRALLNSGLAATSAEWAAVVTFYGAVHLVERLAAAEARRPVHHRTHSDREQYLVRHQKHAAIISHYRVLRHASEISRYGTVNQFRTAYPGATVQDQLIDVHLRAIEEYVAAFFAPPASPPAPPAAGPSTT